MVAWLIALSLPDEPTRAALLSLQLREVQDELKDVDVNTLASMTEGYSGADIVLVCKEAVMVRYMIVVKVVFLVSCNMYITSSDHTYTETSP